MPLPPAVRLQEDRPSIVVVGEFNPARFHPEWFRSLSLLGQKEAEGADIKVVHPQVAHWSVDWVAIQVTRQRFQAEANVESTAVALRDLVVGMLQVLDQTVMAKIGLNRTMHFDVGGETNWHKVGDALAPKDLWVDHFKARPGLTTLQVEAGGHPDGLAGKKVVIVQPSRSVKHGVLVNVNNEIWGGEDSGTDYFVKVIEEHWNRVLEEARNMATAVLEAALR